MINLKVWTFYNQGMLPWPCHLIVDDLGMIFNLDLQKCTWLCMTIIFFLGPFDQYTHDLDIENRVWITLTLKRLKLKGHVCVNDAWIYWWLWSKYLGWPWKFTNDLDNYNMIKLWIITVLWAYAMWDKW